MFHILNVGNAHLTAIIFDCERDGMSSAAQIRIRIAEVSRGIGSWISKSPSMLEDSSINSLESVCISHSSFEAHRSAQKTYIPIRGLCPCTGWLVFSSKMVRDMTSESVLSLESVRHGHVVLTSVRLPLAVTVPSELMVSKLRSPSWLGSTPHQDRSRYLRCPKQYR